jgi:hypothetical protein
MNCNENYENYRNYSAGRSWKINHSDLGNHQGYFKSNDTINLINKYNKNHDEFSRSHDIQFTIGNDTFQEVVCHNERLGGNDEVSCFIILFYILYFILYFIFFIYYLFIIVVIYLLFIIYL